MEITGHEIGTEGKITHNHPSAEPQAVTSLLCSVALSNFRLFGQLKKNMAVKRRTVQN